MSAVNVFVSVICAWVLVYPRPYELAVSTLLLIPWIILILIGGSRGRIRLAGTRVDRHPSLGLSIIFPALILCARSTDVMLVRFADIFLPASIIAAVFLFCYWRADASIRKLRSLWLLVIMAFFLSWGTTADLDILLDRSAGANFTATVLQKRLHRGSKSVSFELQLEPWGPKTNVNPMWVSEATYASIQPGTRVHLQLRSGALGAPWYTMVSWRK